MEATPAASSAPRALERRHGKWTQAECDYAMPTVMFKAVGKKPPPGPARRTSTSDFGSYARRTGVASLVAPLINAQRTVRHRFQHYVVKPRPAEVHRVDPRPVARADRTKAVSR